MIIRLRESFSDNESSNAKLLNNSLIVSIIHELTAKSWSRFLFTLNYNKRRNLIMFYENQQKFLISIWKIEHIKQLFIIEVTIRNQIIFALNCWIAVNILILKCLNLCSSFKMRRSMMFCLRNVNIFLIFSVFMIFHCMKKVQLTSVSYDEKITICVAFLSDWSNTNRKCVDQLFNFLKFFCIIVAEIKLKETRQIFLFLICNYENQSMMKIV
jgi:hypothetical protein